MNGNATRRAGVYWLLLAAAALLSFSRQPGHLTHPELWAEDGVLWLAQAYTTGLASLAVPIAGYLQTISRLGGLLAAQVPLTLAPSIFAWIAFLVQLAPVAFLLSRRGVGLVPSLPARLLLCLYYVGQPNSSEVYVNLTNAMWHLAILMFLIVVAPKPRGLTGLAGDVLLLALAGVSGPMVLFIAPIAWWHVAANRRAPDGAKRMAYAAILSLCAAVQGFVVATQIGQHRLGHLGATLSRLSHILADQIFVGGIVGGKTVGHLMNNGLWMQLWPAFSVCIAGLALVALAFARGPTPHRQFVVFAALIFASGLSSPMVTNIGPQWDPMQYPGIGGRYYLDPMLAWFSTLVVLSTEQDIPGVKWFARFLLLCCAIGIVSDWHLNRYIHTDYHNEAKIFDRAPSGTSATFQENPRNWQFSLVKK
jgi:hypothetical protein